MSASTTLTLRISLVASAMAWVMSCGGTTPPAEQPDTTEAAVEAAPEAEPTAWKDMDREQRMEFMGVTVMPAMKEMFQTFDAAGYTEFKCQTCHGDDMEAADYKMPNGLYSLPPADPVAAAMEYDEKVTKFMEQVTPKMAELLQEEPGKEFNCLSCHESDE
jgi:hypothetical protein